MLVLLLLLLFTDNAMLNFNINLWWTHILF